MALPPVGDLGSSTSRYMHVHLHTGVTTAQALVPQASAMCIVRQTADLIVNTPVGAETFAAGDLPTDLIIPLQMGSIQLSDAADKVLLFW